MKEQYRLVMSANTWLPVPQHAHSVTFQFISGRINIRNLVADMMNASTWITFQNFAIGDLSPSGCSNSNFVFSSSTKIVVTPCEGRSNGSDTFCRVYRDSSQTPPLDPGRLSQRDSIFRSQPLPSIPLPNVFQCAVFSRTVPECIAAQRGATSRPLYCHRGIDPAGDHL